MIQSLNGDSIMSHFPSSHLINEFISGKSEALTGQRLSKIKFKSTEKSPRKYPNVCVSVPYIQKDDIEQNMPSLVDHIRAMLENAQDGIIRSLFESSDGTLTQVQDSEISIASCINYLEAESQGSRLTKELINAWFDDNCKDYLYIIIGQKLKYPMDNECTPEQDATIGKHLNGYRDLFASLAGGKTILQDNQIKSLGNVLGLIEDTEIGDKLKSRLSAMANKPKIEELLEL
jgi:hypothetical protein